MSVKLQRVSGYEAIKALSKVGWIVLRQKGSHVRMKKETLFVTIPLHSELDKGTLKSILRETGLSVQEFIELL